MANTQVSIQLDEEDLDDQPIKSSFAFSHAQIHSLMQKSDLTNEERFLLLRSIAEECIVDSDLQNLLKAKPNPICYDGFEPSGRMHIAQGILKSINVNKCTKAGCSFIFWVADWFALLNNKMGGDLSKIRIVGEYMIEVWKACGMDMSKVKFIWSSNEINSHSNDYWLRVIDISRRFNLTRIKKCSKIMGKKPSDDLFASQMFYPCMQCADIFHLKADICQLGMDQRKVNMLAREYCDAVKIKFKPIILSHHMMMGLLEGQEKMSKSEPGSAIFMEDSEEDVREKLAASFCPAKQIAKNPCIDYLKHLIFHKFDTFSVTKESDGRVKIYKSLQEAIDDFVSGELTPKELQTGLAVAINKMIQLVRDHFKNDEHAKQLLDQVKAFQAEAAAKKEQEQKASK